MIDEAQAETRARHLEPGEVSGFLDRTVSGTDLEGIKVHLESCPRCRRELSEVARIARAGQQQKVRRTGWTLAGGAAAAAAAIVLLVLGPWSFDRTDVERFRTGQAAETGGGSGSAAEASAPPAPGLQGLEALAPPSDRPVDPRSVRFSWGAAHGETVYRLVVTDASGGIVWQGEVSETTVSLDEEVVFRPGERYFWYVDALGPDGDVATTGVRAFVTASS